MLENPSSVQTLFCERLAYHLLEFKLAKVDTNATNLKEHTVLHLVTQRIQMNPKLSSWYSIPHQGKIRTDLDLVKMREEIEVKL